MASGTLERCSLHGWIPVFTVQGRWQTACMASCGWAVCWCQRCGSSGPWWRWGYGLGRRMLWTMNTVAFWMHRDTVTRSWGPLLCHSSTRISSCCSMIMHGPMLQGSVHNSWKLKTSQFLNGQHTPDMSPIEHVWDALDRRIRQHVPVPANIQQHCTTIEEEWTNIPQATINNLINSMRRRCVALREANVGHTIYWLVFGPPTPNTVKMHILEWPFILASLSHACAIIMLSKASWYATPVRWMDYLAKGEVLTNTD